MHTSRLLQAWLTTGDRAALLQPQPTVAFAAPGPALPAIAVDAVQTFQTIEGFGFCLTGGSAWLLSQLPPPERLAVLRELFGAAGVAASVLRLSIGASDLSQFPFSYDERPAGEEDWELAYFDLFAGDAEVVPILREILAIRPDLKILATPWSAPRWMKTSPSWIGGSLRPECQAVYAQYFVRYIEAMRRHGIPIHAMTPQNEPLNDSNEPSMFMSAAEQAEFIQHHLGPALRAAGLDTEIFCWDHNCDVPDYALQILEDKQAREYVAGSAWHLYGGDIAILSKIQSAHPDKKLWFTEQWVGKDGAFGADLRWHGLHVLVGSMREGCGVVLEWNLAADADCGPHTPGGASACVGALTLGGGFIERNVAYYLIAHAARFVPPGALRIASNDVGELRGVAFLTPLGQIALIVCNGGGGDAQSFAIEYQGQAAAVVLPGGALATYVWSA
ncbi:MAG: glycoside hydrolase family 30 protein [Candidatus Methylumidiphilus sp.]